MSVCLWWKVRSLKRKDIDNEDGLDAEPTLSLPQKPSPTPSKDLVESLDVVPDLQTQKLQHVTKERPRRAKNIRPTTRQSNLPTTSDENVKVDEDVEQFFATPAVTPSTPTSNGPSKVEEKTSSAKSTPESKKKGMGIFGFGNKDKENSNKDQKKKTGGLFTRTKPPKNTPPPANKKGSRVSDVVEEPDDDSNNNSPEARHSRLDNTSLSSSKSGSKSSIRSDDSSLVSVSDKDKTVDKDNTSLSDKSSKSSESDTENDNLNSNNNNETIDKKEEESAKPVQEKKALAPPTKKVTEKPVELRKSKTDGEGDTEKDNDVKHEVNEGKEDEQKKDGSDDEKDVKEDKADSSTKEDESTTEKEEPSKDKEEPSKDKEGPSKDMEEPTKEKEESEKEEAETSSPKPTVKKPKGIGFGVNIMAEMKKKQEKRQSMLPGGKPASVDKPATPNTSSVSEEKKSPFGLKSLKPVSAKPKPDIDTKPTTTAKPADNISSDSSKTESVSPTPDKKSMFGDRVKRSSSGRVVDEDKKTPVKESEAGDTSSKPVVTPRPSLPNSKPPPPTRPKPPGKPTPVPRKSVGGETARFRHSYACELDLKTESNSDMTDSGIGFDHDTPTSSVRDVTARFGNGDVTDKAGSLPRNTKPSDLFKDSDTGSKRPRSMFAVVESRPDLKTRESLTRDRDSKKITEEPSDSATKPEDKEEKKSSADEIIMV